MNLKDIIALAKAGYSVSDVKELISMASSEDQEPAEQEEPKDEKTEEQNTGKDTAGKAPEKSTEDTAKVVAIDEYKKQIDDLKNQIKDLQEKNTHKDVSGNKDDKSNEDIINDITRSFM